MAVENKEVIRDDKYLLDCVYNNLLRISKDIEEAHNISPNLVDAFDSLLTTYFDIQEDRF